MVGPRPAASWGPIGALWRPSSRPLARRPQDGPDIAPGTPELFNFDELFTHGVRVPGSAHRGFHPRRVREGRAVAAGAGDVERDVGSDARAQRHQLQRWDQRVREGQA
eukprot:3545609-Pyramimonas_sp.AAC.1